MKKAYRSYTKKLMEYMIQCAKSGVPIYLEPISTYVHLCLVRESMSVDESIRGIIIDALKNVEIKE